MTITAAIAQSVQRIDGWVNALTGLGTLRDKLTHAQALPGIRMQDSTLEALYNDDDLAQKIVDKIPREATRRGFTVELEAETREETAEMSREIMAAFKKLDGLGSLRNGWIWGRLYGGGAVFVGADDGQPQDQPLAEDRIQEIRFLAVLAKAQLVIKTRYSDPQHPKYGQPELFTVNRTLGMGGGGTFVGGASSVDIHESRLIVFGGALTARIFTPSPDGWDDSVLQRVQTVLRDTATTWMSTAHLVSDASQGVLKIAGLVDLVASKNEATLRSRMQIMDMARSVCRSILVDADRESFERVATSFAGLPDLMDRFMMRAAAAAEMPVTILWGRSPAGMNATGESDVRGWYDTVQDAQTNVLQPRLDRLLELLMKSKRGPTKGQLPEKWCSEFKALWQPTDKERADTRKTNAETVVALVNAQVMLAEEGALDLAADFPTINAAARQAALQVDDQDPDAGPDDLRGTPPGGPEPEPEPPIGGGGGVGGAGGGVDVQKQALNGAQVSSLLEVIDKVAIGDLPRETGVRIIVTAFNVDPAAAEQLMGNVGGSFKRDKPVPPPSPFGGGNAPKPPKPPQPDDGE